MDMTWWLDARTQAAAKALLSLLLAASIWTNVLMYRQLSKRQSSDYQYLINRVEFAEGRITENDERINALESPAFNE